MQIKTEGKCISCKEKYTASKGKMHLLKCADALKSLRSHTRIEEGYLVRVASAEVPNMYWMFLAVPKSLALWSLDEFLRDTWLECCGHLSEFRINGRSYMSHTESGGSSQSMEKSVSQFFSPGLEIDYRYDMGSSTELTLEVLANFEACPRKEVTLLMQNEPPSLLCELCKKGAKVICSLCGETTCRSCKKRHSCAAQEGDTYMMMTLVNSPRTGVCGYEGKCEI